MYISYLRAGELMLKFNSFIEIIRIHSYNLKLHLHNDISCETSSHSNQFLLTKEEINFKKGLIASVIFLMVIALFVNFNSFSYAQNNLSQGNLDPNTDNELNTTLHIIQKGSSDSVQGSQYNELGLNLMQQGRYAEAIDYFDKALSLEPSSVAVLINKGISYDMLGNFDMAIQTFDKALEINPNDSDVLGEKGYTLMNNRNYDEALLNFDKALNINPSDLFTLNSKGNLFIIQGKYNDALSVFNKALEINPNDIDLLMNKATALAYLEEYSEALAVIDKILEMDPSNLDALQVKSSIEEVTLTN